MMGKRWEDDGGSFFLLCEDAEAVGWHWGWFLATSIAVMGDLFFWSHSIIRSTWSQFTTE